MIHTISLIAPRGNTISIKACGSVGPVVFLVHGFPLDYRMWLNQIEPLGQRYRVIVPELRGFGGSTVDTPYSIADLAADVELVRAHIANQSRIHLVGLSMGGYVAFEYWRNFAGQLESLVLADTKPSADDDAAKAGRLAMAEKALAEGTWPAVAPMMDRLIAPSSRGTEVESLMRQIMQSASPQSVALAQRAMAERTDFSELLSSIQTRTFVITGELDLIAPPEPTRNWAFRIPNSSYLEFESAGHMTNLEATEKFNTALTQFIG